MIVFWGAIWESVDINAPTNRANTLGNIWTNMLANMLAWFAILHFSKQKQPTFLDFHSFACWLSIKNVRVWSTSMFDSHPHDRWWWQKNTWRLLTAISQSVRETSHQPFFMVSCLAICQTCLHCHLVDRYGYSTGLW